MAFVTGLACVWLTWRMHVANWPVGLVSVAIFAVLFVHARLYADALLQGVFFALGVYGWWSWRRARTSAGLTVLRAGWRGMALLAAAGLAGMWLASRLLIAWTDSPAPVPDAAILSLSLVATWTQARRQIESWWFWIAVDLISVPLYWSRGLPLTAFLYAVFLVICVAGLASWRRRLAHQMEGA